MEYWSPFSFYGETRWLVCTRRNWKPSQSEFLSKDAGPFLKFLSSVFRCFFRIFANRLPGFLISTLTLANVENFFKCKHTFKCKYKCEYKRVWFKYICVVWYWKLHFYCLTCSVTDFRDLIFKIEMLLVFQIRQISILLISN